MKNGGKRPGAGRKRGQNKQTLEKAVAREIVRALICPHLKPLVEAQVANAIGLKYLVVRDKKTGKFSRVTEALARVEDGEEIIEVWEKDPCIQAFTDLMNRAIDKPAEQEQTHAVTGEIVFSWKGTPPPA